jgi:hypothetical protein
LIKHDVLDAGIFVSQKCNNYEQCLNLSLSKIDSLYNSIKNALLNYIEQVNNDMIFIRMDEIKKYLEYGLQASASCAELNKNNKKDLKFYWIRPLDNFYSYKYELSEANKNNKLGIKYKSNNFSSTYEAVEKHLIDDIELILSKMNDYISLRFTFEILCDKFRNSNFKEYSKIFQRMFLNTKISEDIYKSIFNARNKYLEEAKKSYLDELKRGLYKEIEECNYCNKPILDEIKHSVYFKCGHVYHKICCPIERGQYACCICRNEDLEESAYTDIPNLIFRKKENVIKNEILMDDKDEKINVKNYKKNKLLRKLQAIKNKKNDKIDSFKSNIENIKINLK